MNLEKKRGKIMETEKKSVPLRPKGRETTHVWQLTTRAIKLA